MKVCISTIGTFHHFDFAKILRQDDQLSKIYSAFPWWRLKREGLPQEWVETYPWFQTPYMALASVLPRGTKQQLEWIAHKTLDQYIAKKLAPCDIYMGLSGSSLRAGKVAQSRGAQYVCDRCSSHIRHQDEILREEYDLQGFHFNDIVDPRMIDLHEEEYEQADAVTVPTQFAKRTFVEKGVSADKVYVVPYGVDLSRFYPTVKKSQDQLKVLYVGAVSLRKGVGYLFEAFQKAKIAGATLHVIGSVSEEVKSIMNRWSMDGVTLYGALPQKELKDHMSSAHLLVLPSLEEGMAFVQAQAMACGCPVASTPHAGAEDLFDDGVEGWLIKARDVDGLSTLLENCSQDLEGCEAMGQRALKKVQSMGGWDTYAQRMRSVFVELLQD